MLPIHIVSTKRITTYHLKYLNPKMTMTYMLMEIETLAWYRHTKKQQKIQKTKNKKQSNKQKTVRDNNNKQ